MSELTIIVLSNILLSVSSVRSVGAISIARFVHNCRHNLIAIVLIGMLLLSLR